MPACHTGNLYTCHSVFQYPCKIVYSVDKGLIALLTASSPTPSAHEMMNEKVLPHFPGENIEVQKLYNLLDQKTLAPALGWAVHCTTTGIINFDAN